MGLIGNILGALFGSGRNVVKETAEVFTTNAEAADQRSAHLQAAALRQMENEFGTGHGWFHRVVNALNRLPRPLMAFSVMGLLGSAMIAPEWFAARMQGLALVPQPLWTFLGLIATFYFGGREMYKSRVSKMAKEAARITAQTPQVLENIRKLESMRADSPGAADPGPDAEVNLAALEEHENQALAEWRSRRS